MMGWKFDTGRRIGGVSIPVPLAELGAQAADELAALGLVDPVRQRRGDLVGRDRRARQRARGAEPPGRQGSVTRQRAVAEEADQVEVLVQEDRDGDAQPAAELDPLGKINV